MRTMYRVTATAAVIGISLSLSGSAHAGNGSAVGAGLWDRRRSYCRQRARTANGVCRTATASLLRTTSAGLRRAACLRRASTRLRWSGVLRASVSRSSTLATSNRLSVSQMRNPASSARGRVSLLIAADNEVTWRVANLGCRVSQHGARSFNRHRHRQTQLPKAMTPHAGVGESLFIQSKNSS